jgi:uncharacterized membrane protein YgcG
LSALSSLLLRQTKSRAWLHALQITINATRGRASVEVDNQRAGSARRRARARLGLSEFNSGVGSAASASASASSSSAADVQQALPASASAAASYVDTLQTTVGSASALLTFICVLCTLCTLISRSITYINNNNNNLTINMQLSTLTQQFGQIYKQLHFLPPAYLRVRMHAKAWDVRYTGERGIDAGGLFRDSISRMCADLQAQESRLFVPCPNAAGLGDNRDKFVPSPAASSSLDLSMFKFVGKLMGVSIRCGVVLPLDLPSVVWKPLVGRRCDVNDLKCIDNLCFNVLNELRSLTADTDDADNNGGGAGGGHSNALGGGSTSSGVGGGGVGGGVDSDLFADTFFSTLSSDGRVVELLPGGRRRRVTWATRLECR